jgi:AbrB family looped-hinge helix DNA binding protein
MEEVRARINESGRVVIPASFRRALGIRGGDEIVLRLEDDEIRLATCKGNVARARKLVSRYIKPGTHLSDELIKERRKGAGHE